MPSCRLTLAVIFLTAHLLTGSRAADDPVVPSLETLSVVPAEITLHGPRERQPLLVSGTFGNAGEADFTRAAQPPAGCTNRRWN